VATQNVWRFHWPITEVRELDGRTSSRARRHPFNCGTLAAEIEAPAPLGRLLYVNHIPSWQQDFELEREAQLRTVREFLRTVLFSRYTAAGLPFRTSRRLFLPPRFGVCGGLE
jgi:hypothetical protein